jgi:hypothetical protein
MEKPMSLTYEEMTSHERSAYGGFADAIGGIATIVLAILGLAGLAPTMMIGSSLNVTFQDLISSRLAGGSR